MSLDHRLIELLVCPLCKGPLELRRDPNQRPLDLACKADRLAFPIRDGIPVMLESEALPLTGKDTGGVAGNDGGNDTANDTANDEHGSDLQGSDSHGKEPRA